MKKHECMGCSELTYRVFCDECLPPDYQTEVNMKKAPNMCKYGEACCKIEEEIFEEDSKANNIIAMVGCIIVASIMVGVAWFTF